MNLRDTVLVLLALSLAPFVYALVHALLVKAITTHRQRRHRQALRAIITNPASSNGQRRNAAAQLLGYNHPTDNECEQ